MLFLKIDNEIIIDGGFMDNSLQALNSEFVLKLNGIEHNAVKVILKTGAGTTGAIAFEQSIDGVNYGGTAVKYSINNGSQTSVLTGIMPTTTATAVYAAEIPCGGAKFFRARVTSALTNPLASFDVSPFNS